MMMDLMMIFMTSPEFDDDNDDDDDDNLGNPYLFAVDVQRELGNSNLGFR